MVRPLSFVIAKVVHAVTGLRFGAEAEEQSLGSDFTANAGSNMVIEDEKHEIHHCSDSAASA